MSESDFRELLIKWSKKQTTSAEEVELAAMLSSLDEQNALMPELYQLWIGVAPDALTTENESHQMVDRIFALSPSRMEERENTKRALPRIWQWAVAAAILCLLAATGWWIGRFSFPKQGSVELVQDINPGKSRAILTLANGKRIALDSMGNQVIAPEAALRNGELVYNSEDMDGEEIAFNTLTTAKGEQFKLLLADGSAVWLNSGSTIRFPVHFPKEERKVEVTGELYFEVAPDKAKIFRVVVNGAEEIEVLGTHFNVKAYGANRTSHTTLLEGKVKVVTNVQQYLLSPGEVAIVSNGGNIKMQTVSSPEQAIAWKNGVFDFRDKHLSDIMEQIANWYDVEVEIEKEAPDVTFWGKIERNVKLSEIMNFLHDAKVNFRLEKGGRKVVITK